MDLPLEFLEKVDIIVLLAIAGMFWVFNGRLDKKFDKIDFKINDLGKRIEDLSAKVDRNEANFNGKLDAKIDPIEKDIIQMNTRMAVMESRLSDISTNVTHLMWHSQAVPSKEEAKEN
jgi:hypothetical protein